MGKDPWLCEIISMSEKRSLLINFHRGKWKKKLDLIKAGYQQSRILPSGACLLR